MNLLDWLRALRGRAILGGMAALLPLAASAQAPVAPAASAPALRQPVAGYASLPLLADMTLSPDGKQIAALMNQKQRTVLITRPVMGSVPSKAVLVSDNKEFLFNWIHWVSNDRLLVSLRFASRRQFVGTVETRLLSVKTDGSGVVNLVRNAFSLGIQGRQAVSQFQDRVVDWLPEDGRHVLLELAEPGSIATTVYKVDVETGARSRVKSSERNVYHWITDAQHRVRVGLRQDEGRYEVIASDPDGKNWRPLWSFRDTKDAVWPMGFGRDPQELFVSADHEGRAAVSSVRLDDPALPRRLHQADPRRDVGGRLIRSPLTGEVLGLRSGGLDDETGEPRMAMWDAAWRAQVQAIDQALPGRDNRLLDMSLDERHYLVYSSGNRQPGEYYLGDRKSGDLSLLGETYPQLDASRLAGKRSVTIQSRDGLSLNAYLTLPAGRRAGDGGAALPMVLLPRGGPASRDSLDFDTWTEFLADRGYAVLQVNFRGNTGYGHEFESAGLRRWGLEMQDDLADAVQWAIRQQVADASRVCIVGASYGGYAALMGAVKTPELYRCAVSFAGVTDLIDLIAHKSNYIGGRAAAEHTIGLAWGDRERLRATSPALQAERIRVPVLLVHGTSDRVVPVEQSADMAKALKRAGKSYRYIEQEGGDHYLSQYGQRLEFFEALEAFLDENLAAVAAN